MANELELDVLPGPKDNSWEKYYSNKGLFPFDHLSLDKVNKLIVKDFEQAYWFLMYFNKEEGRLFNGGEYHSNITPELKKLEGLMSFEDAFRIFKEKEIDDKNERLVLIYNNPYIDDYEEDDDYWELGLNNDAFGYIILSKGNDELETDNLTEDLELDVLDTKPTIQQKGPYEYVIRFARDLNGIENIEKIIDHKIRTNSPKVEYEDDMVKVIIRPEYHNTYLRYIVNYPDAYGMMRAINPVSVPNPHWYDWAPEDESEEDKAWTKESIEKAKKLDDLFGLDVSTRWLKEVGPIREEIDLDISEDNINHEYLVNNDCVDFIQKHKDERQWVVGLYEPSGIGTEFLSTHVTFDEAYRIFNNCVLKDGLHVMVAYMKQFEGKVVLRKPNEYKEELDLDVVDTRAIATDRQGRYGFIRYEIIDPEIKEEIIANLGGSAHWREKVKRYLEEPYVWDLMFWNHPSSHQGYINIWKDETRRERVVGTYEDGPRPSSRIVDKILNRALDEKIVKKGSKWQVQSEKGRNLGTYDTKGEAEDRLQQVHYFKHKNEELEVSSDLNNHNVEEDGRDSYIIKSYTLKEMLLDKYLTAMEKYSPKNHVDMLSGVLRVLIEEGMWILELKPTIDYDTQWIVEAEKDDVGFRMYLTNKQAEDIINNKVESLDEDFDVIDVTDQGGTYETNDQEYYILHVQQAQVFIDSIKPYVESTQDDYEVLFLKDFIEHMTEENLEEGFVTVELCKEHGNVYVILWDDADSCEFSISEEDYKKYKLDEVVKLEDIPTYALDEDLDLDPVEWKDSDMQHSEIRASDFRVIGERYILTGSRKDLLFNLLSQEGDAATIEEYFTSPKYTVEVTGYTHPHTPEMKPNYYVRFIDNNTHLPVTGFGLFRLSISKEIFDAVTSPEIEEELELDVLDNDHSEWKEYAFPFSNAYTIDDYEEVILSRGNNNNEWCLSLHRTADEEYYNGNVDEMPEDLDDLNGFFDFETAFKKFKEAKLAPGDELLLDYFPEDFNDPDYGDMSVLYRKGPEITEDFDVVDVPKVIDNPNEITDRKVKEAIVDALKQSGASEDTIYGLESHIRNKWEIYTYEYDDGGLPYILIFTRTNKLLGRVGISRDAFEIVQDMMKDDLKEYLTDEIELDIADDKYKHLDYKKYIYDDGKNNPEEHIQLEGGNICWSLQVTDIDGNIWAGYFDELPEGYNEYQDFETGYDLFREYQPSPKEFSIDLVCTSNLDTDDQETVTVLRREFDNVDESIKEDVEDFDIQTSVLDPFLTEIPASDIIEQLTDNFNIYITPDGKINMVQSDEDIGPSLENAIFDYTEDYCVVLRPSSDSLFSNLNHIFIELPKGGKNLTPAQIKFLEDNINILKDNANYEVSLNVSWTDDVQAYLDYKTSPEPEEIDEELEEIINSTDNYNLIRPNDGEGVIIRLKSDDIKQIVKDICNRDIELDRQEIRRTPENIWIRYGYCRVYNDIGDFANLMTPRTPENKIADCENKVDMILANVLSKQDYDYVINSEAYKDAFGDDEDEIDEDIDLEVTNDKPKLIKSTHNHDVYELSNVLATQLVESIYYIDSNEQKYKSRLGGIEAAGGDIKLVVWHFEDELEYDLRIGSLVLILTNFDVDCLNSKSGYYDPIAVKIGEEIDKVLGFTYTKDWRNKLLNEDLDLDVMDIPDYKHNYDVHVNYGGPLNPDEVIAEYFGEPVWTLTVESTNALDTLFRGWEGDLPEGFNGWFTFAEGYQKLLEFKDTYKFYKSIGVHLCCKYTSNEYQGIYSVLFRYIDNRNLEEILKEDFEYDLISERSWVIDDESSDVDGVYYLGTDAKDYILEHFEEIFDVDKYRFMTTMDMESEDKQLIREAKHQLEDLYGDTWLYGSKRMQTKRYGGLATALVAGNFKGYLFPDKIEPYLEIVAEKRSMKDAAGITENMNTDVVSNLDISDTSVVDDKNIETLVRFLEDCGDEVVVIDNVVFEGQPLGVKDDIGDWKTIFDCAFECRDGLVTVYYGIPFGTDADEAKLWDSIKDNTLNIKEWKEKYSRAADSLTEVTLEEVMSYLAELWGWSREEMNQYLD